MTVPYRSRILVVDDSLFNRKILNDALSPVYEVLSARNGEEAISLCREEQPPDIVLLDIMIPGMDGHEVCKRLKNDPATKEIPIIFITAMTDVEDETLGLELGAVDYITKPFSIPIVQARVRTHLELKRQRDILRDMTTIDGLTGIPNRRRFDEFLRVEWLRARRNKHPLAVVLADIDEFKAYNDNYGHLKGDEALKAVAEILQEALHRPTDLLARYGGEEFVAVLPETDFKGAVHFGEYMRSAVLDAGVPHAWSSVEESVTISVGVACVVPTSEVSEVALVTAADKQLYRAKEMGRNRVCSIWMDEES